MILERIQGEFARYANLGYPASFSFERALFTGPRSNHGLGVLRDDTGEDVPESDAFLARNL
jgi:hypothetical protein